MKFSRHTKVFGLLAAAAVALPLQAKADIITGTFSAVPATTSTSPLDLTGGGTNLDWIQFEGGSTGTAGGSSTTGNPTKASGSQFSNLIAPVGGYPGGTGYFGASTPFNAGTSGFYVSYLSGGSTVISQDYASTREHSNGSNANISGTNAASTNLTLTLTQTEEIVKLYLTSYNTSEVYSAYLGTGETTSGTPLYTSGSSNGVLPDGTAWDTTTGGNQAGVHAGVLTLDVVGSVGEVLTFTGQQFSSTGTGYPNIGIEAATVALPSAAVPEPASLGVMGIGALALLRRRSVVR
ncbi:MAG TPA: PEP-CTERM sorting domain-containing protein [Phycisphaerae bacterium]|nr:PEP-CTERM sorting domain-containing protein [Phycisphaerae bacterium]